LSIGDFAATLAAYDGTSASAGIHRANLEFENYFSTDPKGSFSWPIHPEGFSAPELLDLGRLRGWPLKPAHSVNQLFPLRVFPENSPTRGTGCIAGARLILSSASSLLDLRRSVIQQYR
jgi:hypothetical protein